MNKYLVSVVIPNYNGAELLTKNLPKLIEAKKNSKNNIKEIIVVDDGSADNSLAVLKNNFPEVKIIKHKINRGFSASVNTGARASSGNLLLLLNNDVLVSTDFLESVFDDFENNKVFAVSLHEKGFGGSLGKFKDGYIEIGTKSESRNMQTSFYVSGGSGIFRKSIWQELSGMDEKLLSPFYWEDLDLCYRAQKRGYVCLWSPYGNVLHNHESTMSKLPRKNVSNIRERNQLLVIWKNVHSKALFRKHIIGVFSRSFKHVGYLKIVFMAILKLPSLLKLRQKEFKESVVSDEVIFERFHD